MWVDSHCHLDFPDFETELDEVVARARRAGVGGLVTICTHLSRFDQVHRVAERYAEVVCTAGVHPHHAAEEDAGATDAALVAAAGRPKVVGLGESGLDYHYDKSPREVQQAVFRRHIRASLDTGLPLVIHTREAENDTLRLLREEAAGAPLSGVLHCFSGSDRLAEEGLALGLMISFSGIVTFKRAEDLRATARRVPLDRLMVETDAPYLAPVPHRGKRNEPAYVVHTAAVVAETLGVPPDRLAAATTANAARLFSSAPAWPPAVASAGAATVAAAAPDR